MKIKRIQVKNFKGLRDFECEFDSGLNVVFGPNESGKSTLQIAILSALFRDAASTSKEIENWASWKSWSKPVVEAELEIDSKTFKITRDFDSRENIFCDVNSGEKTKSKDKIIQFIQDLSGFSNERLFLNSAAIKQGELVSNFDDIKQSLLEAIAGTIISPQNVIKDLAIELDGLKKGLERFSKFPGKIQEKINKIESLNTDLQEKAVKIGNAHKALEELPKIDEELIKLNKSYLTIQSIKDHLVTVMKEVKDCIDLFNRYKKAEERLNRIRKAEKKIEENKKNQTKLEKEAKKLPIKEATEIKKNLEDKGEWDKKVKNLVGIIKKAKDLNKKINENKKKLDTLPNIDFNINDKVLELSQFIKTSEDLIAEQKLSFTITPFKEIEGKILIDGSEQKFEGKEKISSKFANWAKIEIKDVAMIDINSSKDLKGKLSELDTKKDQLKEILENAGVLSLSEFKDLYSQITKLIKDTEKWETELKIVLQGETIGEYELELKKTINDLKNLNATISLQQKEIGDFDPDEVIKKGKNINDEFQRLRGGLETIESDLIDLLSNESMQEIQDKISEAKDEYSNLRVKADILKSNLPQEIKRSMKKLTNEEDVLDFLEVEREKTIETLDGLRNEINNLNEKKVEYTYMLRGVPDEEDLIEINEEINKLELEKKNLIIQKDVIEKALEILGKAQQRHIKQSLNRAENEISIIVSKVTRKKYESVKLDFADEDNILKVDSLEKGAMAGINELSDGTRDLLYISARMIFANIVSGDKNPPLLFDESFHQFDEERFKSAVEVLKEVSRRNQVFIFSCDTRFHEILGANLVILK
ncbi:MAG: SMC family ATPase [Actinobacteria bacterium]|nr:SMC family ATPase [Actinomycetota bacterium]